MCPPRFVGQQQTALQYAPHALALCMHWQSWHLCWQIRLSKQYTLFNVQRMSCVHAYGVFDLMPHSYAMTLQAPCRPVPPIHPSCCAVVPQVVDTITASTDGPVLERLAKVLGYMRVAGAGQNGKRLKRKDKLRMLEALDEHSQRSQAEQHRELGSDRTVTPANGHLLPPTAAAKAAAKCAARLPRPSSSL